MSPEAQSRLADLAEFLVAKGRLVWSGDQLALGTVWETWNVLEVVHIWNKVSWWPDSFLLQVLDLIQSCHFEQAALSETKSSEAVRVSNWYYQEPLSLKRLVQEHIAKFDEPRPAHAAYQPKWDDPGAKSWIRVAKLTKPG